MRFSTPVIPTRPRAVVFDFDGVLAESMDVKKEAFARLFAHEGEDVVRQFVAYHETYAGRSRYEKIRYCYREILKRPLSEEEFQRACDRFAILVVEGVVAAPWVPGALDVLDVCQKRSHLLFLISATPQDEMCHIAERRGISSYFREILGSPKEKEDHLSYIVAQYRLDPNEVLYIGDAERDYDAAKVVGVTFIARATTKHFRSLWIKEKIPMLEDLTTLVQHL